MASKARSPLGWWCNVYCRSDATRLRVPPGDDPLLRLLVQNASDIVTVLEADGTIRYINLAVERAFGYNPEELVGTCVLDMVHPDDLERSQQNLAENLANPGFRPPSTFRMPHKDGSWRHFEHVVNNLLEDPDVGGLVVSSRDVTERREAEEGHRESKERYRTLVERIPAVT